MQPGAYIIDEDGTLRRDLNDEAMAARAAISQDTEEPTDVDN